MDQTKNALRQHYIQVRHSLDDHARDTANARIHAHLTALLEELSASPTATASAAASAAASDSRRDRGRLGISDKATLGRTTPFTVGVYAAFRGEVDPLPLVSLLTSRGWKVAVPKTDVIGKRLAFYQISADTRWVTGPYGILEPDASEKAAVDAGGLDVIVVPGVAYTRSGIRIGYGGGYYDRLFASDAVHAIRVGMAFDVQIADALPHADHDARMHYLVTDSGIVRCGA